MKSRIRELLTTWNILRIVLLVGWAAWIIYMYYVHHPEYLVCRQISLQECVAQFGGRGIAEQVFLTKRMLFVYVLFALYGTWCLWRGKKQIQLRVLPIWLVVWIYLFAVLSINLLFLFHPVGANPGVAFFFAQPSIFIKLGLLLVTFVTVILTGCSFGSYILNRLQLTVKNNLHQFLFALCGGWIALTAILFILASVGLLSTVVTIPVLVAGLILSRRELHLWVRRALTEPFVMSFRAVSLEAFAVIIIHAIVALSLVEAFTPIPMNWDGMYRYINTVQLITSSGSHITGVFPYPFELVMSTGQLLFKSMMASISFTWFSIWLAGLALYTYARTILKPAIASVITAVFFTMPFMFYLMSMETKIDMAAVFYALVALLALQQWVETRKHSWLLFASVLVGFGCSIKLTSAFFAVGFVALVVYFLYTQQKRDLKRIAVTLALVGIALVAPSVPWVVKHLVEANGRVTLHTITQGGYDGPDFGACSVSEDEHYLPGGAASSYTGHHEEIGRYWGYGPRTITRYLLLPWQLTMNTTVAHPLVQIGPLFLILLPAFLLFYRKPTELEQPIRTWRLPLTIATIVTWVVWALFGQAIIWYGTVGLLLYLILIGMLWQSQTPHQSGLTRQGGNRGSYITITVITLTSIVLMFLYRAVMDPQQEKIHYLSGFKDEVQIRAEEPTGLQALADRINADAPTREEPKYIYNVGSYIIYRIEHNDTRIYNDHFLDSMSCLLASHKDDYEATLADLKARGFKYIIVNPDVTLIDETPDQTLVSKGTRVATFIIKMSERGKLERIALDVEQHLKHVAFKISE